MKKIFFHKYMGIFLAMLLPGYGLLHAQSSYDIKQKLEFTHCGTSIAANIYADMVELDYYLDGKQINSAGAVYTAGKHDFRVVVRDKYPREGFDRKFGIKEISLIALHKDPNHNHRAETHSLFGKDVKIALNTAQLSGDYVGYSMVITVDRCDDGEQANEANVKIISTMITEAGGPHKPFPDIHVEIGDQVIPIDMDGTGWFKIRPGQYTMNYHWDKTKTPANAEDIRPGAVSLRATKSGASQQLVTIPRKGNEEILECKVPLLKENAGSGNLYDYELEITTLIKLVNHGAVNEVRVIAVQPDVQVHKAGTPEDSWLEVKRDMVLQQGDEISCDPEGAATLQFADNSTVVVKNTTQLKIAAFFTEGGVVKTEILLKMGEVAAKVHKSEATKSDFRIKPPSGPGSVRGTTFSMKYEPSSQTTIIKVEEGVVDFTPEHANSGKITLNGGQQLKVEGSTVGSVMPFTAKIDFAIAGKKTITNPVSDVSGDWQIIQGSYKGVLKLKQDGSNLSGVLEWDNHQKGVLESGTLTYGSLIFVVVYDGDLRGYYNARLDETGMKMQDGKGSSNKGTESTWSASRLR